MLAVILTKNRILPKIAEDKNNNLSLKDKEKTINYYLTALFFAGLILQVFAIGIYRSTIINWKITTAIWLVVGLITQRLTTTLLNSYYNTTNYFMQLFFNVCSFGGIAAFCFLSANYYLTPNSQTETLKTPIIKIGHLAKGKKGCNNPYANIEIYNTEKQIVFPCDTPIENYKYVTLTTRKGLFGFYTIIDKQLE